ncbi:peptidase domain-containing ABC transporter [Clostridium boliviensis]|uniref:Peptidase domain-containing ABC transporter n=1 Tax=Clostridium boliviensis TaxID=318465 RepID=A0ABU4GQZ3_9CLOT|nr:peptidase domain-containing ABC transporter [Clostridium boliviensis]MDW2800054.1 peptidase domain-containing ABC transporter [Clostridium boliviensis]
MRYKCIKQYDSADCASACIASIVWHYGKKVSLSKIQNYTNMNKDGININDIINASQRLGMLASAAKKTEKFNSSEIELPCIAHVYLENGAGHFIVIYDIKKDNLIISDPAVGLIKVDKDGFFNSNYTESSPYKWSGILIFLKPGKDFTKNSEETNNRKFWKLVIFQRENAIKIIILSFLSMLLSILMSFYFQIIIDIVIPNKWEYSLVLITFIFIGLTIINAYISKLRIKLSLDISKNISLKLSLDYFEHTLNLPLSFHESRKNGDIISRFQDASKIQEILVTSILVLPVDIMFIIIVGIILCLKSIQLFILVLIMCISYIISIVIYREKYSILNAKHMNQQSVMTSHLVDCLDGIETIKVYQKENNIFNSGKLKFNKWQNLILQLGNVENNQAALQTIINSVGEILILCVGTFEVIHGLITLGELITYNILIRYMLMPISNIVNLQPEYHMAKVAMERLDSIMDAQIEFYSGYNLESIKRIEMRNINYSFNSYKNVLNLIGIKIDKGKNIAIVGDNGSGKTTIAKLLMKLYMPQSGEIFINSVDYSKLSLNYVRKHIGYVTQEDFIFSGSVKDNLLMGEINISEDRLVAVAKMMGVHDFVSIMPRGYDSVLTERGNNISKGQRQKIALARAVLYNPDFLILDEATSNMDINSEHKIIETLKKDTNITLIIITHRLNNILDCNRIFVMDKGYIVAEGSHEDLLKNSQLYRKYYENQEGK